MARVATSYYGAKDRILASGLVPVAISIGRPKWPLPFTLMDLPEAAPWGLLKVEDEDEFRERYRDRLNRVGVERFQRRFAEIAEAHDGRGLALLCFEPVGKFCHRHVFAHWLEEQTCEHVRELPSDTMTLFERS